MDSEQTRPLRNLKHLKASNTRIIFVVMSALVLLVFYFIIHGYVQNLNQSQAAVIKRLHTIAFTSAKLIDGEEHQLLLEKYSHRDDIQQNNDDSLYNKVHETLSTIAEINNLETPIYTLVFFPSDSSVRFVASSSAYPYYLHTYERYPKEIIAHYTTGHDLDEYEDENGTWLSSFAPIKDRSGKTVALIQADQKFDSYLAAARTELIGNTVLSVGIIIPFVILLYLFVSKLLKKQVENQELLHEQNEEIKTQSDIIEKNNLDLEKKVIERTLELEKRNEEINNFLYHSAHDVQAPLATLKGLLSLARKDLTDAQALEYIQRMESTTEVLERIIQIIKQVHEIKNSSSRTVATSLQHVIERSVYNLDIQPEEMEVLSELPDKFQLVTDPKLLQMALYELLKNAYQYRSKKNGSSFVKLSIANQTQDEIYIGIDDNGEGISPHFKEEIFAMFSRGHEKSSGMGLGLFIVQACLERMDGSIRLEEKDTPGARFTLQFKNLTEA